MLDQKVGVWTIHMALFDIFEKSHLARCALFLPCHAAGQTKVEHFQMAALPSPRRAAVRAVAMRKLAHELDDVAAKERIGRANRASHRSKCNNQQRMQKTRTQRAYVVP